MSNVWFCLASGPSQTREDLDAVANVACAGVIAVNNTIFDAPWADVLYSYDAAWWAHYSDVDKEPVNAEILYQFNGRRISADRNAAKFGVSVVKTEEGPGLGLHAIRTGNNSGYQAINLAFLQGAKTIVLLGYDMQHGALGEHHYHADHPRPLGNFNKGMPEICAPKFTQLARDLQRHSVRVLNATRNSALECFERVKLADILACLPSRHSAGFPARSAGFTLPTK